MLERRKPASREQRVIAVHFGDEGFLRGHGEHLCRRNAEHRRTHVDLALDFRLDLRRRAELIPKAVDLVQNDDSARFGCGVFARQMLLPDVERSEEHTSELQSHSDLVCRLLLEKKKTT